MFRLCKQSCILPDTTTQADLVNIMESTDLLANHKDPTGNCIVKTGRYHWSS